MVPEGKYGLNKQLNGSLSSAWSARDHPVGRGVERPFLGVIKGVGRNHYSKTKQGVTLNRFPRPMPRWKRTRKTRERLERSDMATELPAGAHSTV